MTVLRLLGVLVALAGLAHPGVALALTDRELVSLIGSGRVAEARASFATLRPTPTDWLFFEARVAKAGGAPARAVTLLDEVLRRDPGYLAARRERAHSLLLMGDHRAAARAFRHLHRIDPSEVQRRGYRRFLDEIALERRVTLGLRFALLSSSNVNRGSGETRFRPGGAQGPAFDITSRAEAGSGIEIGLTGRHLWPQGPGSRLSLDWALSGRGYDDPDHNSATLDTRLDLAMRRGTLGWIGGPFLSATRAADGETSRTVGFGATADWRATEALTLFLSGSAAHRDASGSDARDGMLLSAELGASLPIAGAQLTFGLRRDVQRPQARHLRHTGRSAFARVSRSWRGGFSGTLGFEMGERLYAADFPLSGAPRHDRFGRITLLAQHDALAAGRLAPQLHCTLGVTHSNVAFYDHRVEECTLAFVNRF